MQISFYTESIRLSVYHFLAFLGAPLTLRELPHPSPSFSRQRNCTNISAPCWPKSWSTCCLGRALFEEITLVGRLPCLSLWELPNSLGTFLENSCTFHRSLARQHRAGQEGERAQVSDSVYPLVINYLLDPLAWAERGASVYILQEASPTRGGKTQNRRSRAPRPGSWLSI